MQRFTKTDICKKGWVPPGKGKLYIGTLLQPRYRTFLKVMGGQQSSPSKTYPKKSTYTKYYTLDWSKLSGTWFWCKLGIKWTSMGVGITSSFGYIYRHSPSPWFQKCPKFYGFFFDKKNANERVYVFLLA